MEEARPRGLSQPAASRVILQLDRIFLKAERALYNGNTDTNVNSSDLAQGLAQLLQGPDRGRVARRWRAVCTAGGETCQTPGVSPALGDFETTLQPSQRSSINSQHQIGLCVCSEPGGELLWRPPRTLLQEGLLTRLCWGSSVRSGSQRLKEELRVLPDHKLNSIVLQLTARLELLSETLRTSAIISL